MHKTTNEIKLCYTQTLRAMFVHVSVTQRREYFVTFKPKLRLKRRF